MMEIRTLISKEDFTQYRHISKNIDAKQRLEPYMLEAQRFDIVPFLGSDIITEILDQLETGTGNTNTLTTLNETLLELIKPVCVFFSYARMLANQPVQVTRYGVVTKNDDNSEPVSEKTLARLINQANNIAEAYKIDLLAYLKDNADDYPLYKPCEARKKRMQIKAIGD